MHPQRTRSTRLGGNNASQPLGSPIHPTKYPLSPSSSIRSNGGKGTLEAGAGSVADLDYSGRASSLGNSVPYEPPKFRTFQERKKEKDRQLALAAGREWHDPDVPTSSSVAELAQELVHHSRPEYPTSMKSSLSMPSPRSPTPNWPGREPSIILPGVGVPLAPANILSSDIATVRPNNARRPLPSPTQRTNSISSDIALSAHNFRESGLPRAQGPPEPSVVTIARSPIKPEPPARSYPDGVPTSAPNNTRRLPKPKASVSSIRQQIEQTTLANGETPEPLSAARAPGGSASIDYGPVWRRDAFNRTDTVTSVKSLDRYGACQPTERPLPMPPVGVGSSRSLDRKPVAVSPMTTTPSIGRSSPSVGLPSVSVQASADGAAPYRSSTETYKVPGGRACPPDLPAIVAPSDTETGDSRDDHVEVPARIPSPMRSYSYSTVPKISVASMATEDFDTMPANIPGIVLPGGGDGVSDIVISFGAPEVPAIVMPEDEQPSSSERAREPPVQRSGPGIFCERCDTAIIGRIVSAMDKRWHPACFQCSTCRTLLEHVSSYEHDGKAYCHMDYHDLFAPKCHYCETAIVDSRYITIDDPALGHRYYHELHFFCGECGDPFLDPSKSSSAGTEFNKGADSKQESDDLTKEFIINGKHAFCVECDVKLHRPKCAGCRKPIRDEALGAMGAKWHKECFCCAQCDASFPNGTFFPMDDEPFCQDCYTASLQNGR
ncbi:hypothetical protein HD553DRAFT_278944 [Filobasidium floriforme]|uniref:uncharacterized protein n=1 Tax=Filobasidium floriforme TaxID=5210 RepID=UPI001E8ED4AC|nr:uncharacterized protein HD553DRAFT_278944 [Filobasidium floriforme]KAH8090432.1 hypothetical protein HD553DRAFT_278944 [Filobasidium floriforme]